MADLSTLEKHKLEKLFGMGNGYVLDFSDKTFQSFILEKSELDILSDKYMFGSGSKANRLRRFWIVESNYIVGKLTAELIAYWKDKKIINEIKILAQERELYDECLRIT